MRGIIAVVAVALLVLGGLRLPADLMDIPGNQIAEKLTSGNPVSPRWLSRVLNSRASSIQSHPTADRWFATGHAFMQAGDPAKSAAAFANGLHHAPARGIAWAAYANLLEAMGEVSGAAAAREYSVERAPYDPRALRLRRPR